MNKSSHLFLIIILSLSYNPLIAQTSKTQTQVLDSIFGKALASIANNELEQANLSLIEAEQNSIALRNENNYYLYSLVYQAYCQNGLGDFFRMNEVIRKAQMSFENFGKKDSVVLMNIHYFLGLSNFKLGNSIKALAYYQSTYDLYKRYKTFGFRIEDLYNNMAICFLDFADYNKVDLFIQKAINSEAKNINNGDLATWHNLKAKSLQYQKLYKKANNKYEEALRYLEGIDHVQSTEYKLWVYNDYTNFLIESERIEEAKLYLDKIDSLDPKNNNLINHIQNKGRYNLKKEDEDSAMFYFNQAIELSQLEKGTKNFDTCETYIDMGDLFANRANHKKAIELYNLAINSILPNGSEIIDEFEVPTIENLLVPKLCLKASIKKAKSIATIDYKKSIPTMRSIIEIVDYMISIDIRMYNSKLSFAGFIKQYYAELMQLALENEDTNFAFEISRKSHGTVLDLQIDQNKLMEELISDVDYSKRERELKQRINRVNSELFNPKIKNNSSLHKKKHNELFESRYQYDLFLDSTYASLPGLREKLFTSQSKFNLEKLRETALTQKSAIIEYFMTDSVLISFTITDTDINYVSTNLPNNFHEIVETYVGLCSSVDINTFNNFVDVSYDLFEILVLPNLEFLNNNSQTLYIIPDDIISYVSFDALIMNRPLNIENNRYDQLNYLLRRYEINYNYSSELYKNSSKRDKLGLSGFAPKFNIGQDLSPLKYNIEEVIIINDIYNGELNIDSSATITQFNKSINNYNIAHLATHAICNDTLPMQSKIHFHEDAISTQEIYNLPHKLDLVVLSACETGTGKLSKGEGIMSLARAFIASGCESVVTSLWNANDRTTVSIMKDFYTYLSKGDKIGYALHKGKLNYLNNTQSIMDAHPYYWSGFVLVGEDSGFKHIRNYSMYILLIISVIYIFFYSRRKMNA